MTEPMTDERRKQLKSLDRMREVEQEIRKEERETIRKFREENEQLAHAYKCCEQSHEDTLKQYEQARELLKEAAECLDEYKGTWSADMSKKIRALLAGEGKEGTCGALYEAGYTSKEAANSRDRSQWVERRCTRVAGHKGSCES